GVSTLEGLAFNLPHNQIVVPMIDARRKRVYTGIYSWEEGKIRTIMEPDVIEVESLLEKLTKYDRVVVNGDGTSVYRDEIKSALEDRVYFSTIGQNFCKASSIAELALLKYQDGQRDNQYTLVPEYLRRTQAERELKEKVEK